MNKARKSLLLFACLILAVLITGGKSLADGEPVDNGIPVVYVTIDESKGTIDAMHESEDHSASCIGTVSIDVPDGFHYSDMQGVDCKDLAETGMKIRGRGNSTWAGEKRPYKLKLDSKENVLGLGKNKHWVLLANAFDRTLIKDRITAWLGDAIGMEFTPRGVPVDLVMRNTDGTYEKYLGSYYLSEQVRVGSNRVDIDELEESDTDPSVITGGYLVQNGLQTDEASPAFFKTKGDFTWANHTPNFDPEDDGYINDAQKDYIRGYMQAIEDELTSLEFEGEHGSTYRDLMDVDSAALYWLVMQASKNADAYGTGSTYLYKKRNDKMYWGPLWDFDYAWYYDTEYEGFDEPQMWVGYLLCDKANDGFIAKVKQYWPQVKTALLQIAEDGGIIDRYYAETKLSQAKDLELYPPALPEEDEGGMLFDPEEDKERFKTWIRNRVAWMDGHLDDLDTYMHIITAIEDEGREARYALCDGSPVFSKIRNPKKEGYIFNGWVDEEGNPVDAETDCTRDMTITAQYISKSEVTGATDLLFLFSEDYVNIDDVFGTYQVKYTAVPLDAVNREVYWSSSDEKIATVDEYGALTFHKAGDVTITGKLDSGASASMVLHIYDKKLAAAASVTTEKAVYELKTGEYAQIHLRRTPEISGLSSLVSFEIDDSDVAEVNNAGAIHALQPGRTTITITYYDPDSGEATLTATCEVIVAEETPEPEPQEEITYTCASGADQTWQKDSRDALVFTFKRSAEDETTFDHFTGIRMDGQTVDSSAYTAKKGSVILELLPAYLETLAEGKHSLELLFDDGKADVTDFTIAAKQEEEKGGNNGGNAAGPGSQDGKKTDSTSPAAGKEKSIKTGDESHPALLGGLCILSLAGILVITMRKRRVR